MTNKTIDAPSEANTTLVNPVNVFISEVKPSVWSARDETNTRGGLFSTKLDAVRYVRTEFQGSAKIIQVPTLPVTGKPGASSARSGQSRSAIAKRQCHLIQRDSPKRKATRRRTNRDSSKP